MTLALCWLQPQFNLEIERVSDPFEHGKRMGFVIGMLEPRNNRLTRTD